MIQVIFRTIIWGMISYATSSIIAESSLFKPIRNFFLDLKITAWLGRLLSCILCTSVWVSAFFAYNLYSPAFSIWGKRIIGTMELFGYDVTVAWVLFLDGMLGSCIVWWIHILENKVSE